MQIILQVDLAHMKMLRAGALFDEVVGGIPLGGVAAAASGQSMDAERA